MEDYENRTPEQWVDHYQSGYLRTLNLETATRIIKSDMTNMARTCVSIGFHLKAVRDRELFQEAGYANLWEYAADQFGLSMSSTSRYIAINDQFSVGGNTPQLQKEYRNFSKSQLQEMITMSDEQKALITEDMTVREIRKIKNPKPVEQPAPEEEEQIPGQMEIEDYPDVLPEKESVATSQQTGKCLHRPEFMCTLADEDKKSPGIGEDCSRHCCWTYVKHGDCKLECSSSSDRPDVAESQQEEENVAEVQQEQHQEKQLVSAYGFPVRTYPPDTLIATPGCGDHDCFSCHMDGCRIRQEECCCVEAPMGNLFPCTMLEEVERLREDVGNSCQFVNHDLAYHRAGDQEPVPCCKECENLCAHACSRTKKALEQMGGSVPEMETKVRERSEVNASEYEAREEPEEKSNLSDIQLLQLMMEKEKADLEEYLRVDKVEKLPENMIRKKKLLVGALAGFICDLDLIENPPEKPEQPELPVMRNNDQRKEWLRNYRSWGLWYEDANIGAKYYKYEFENGATLIAEEYDCQNPYAGTYTTSYLHLVGGPEPPKHAGYGFGKWQRNERYNRYPNNETELVEFLKYVQKGGKV